MSDDEVEVPTRLDKLDEAAALAFDELFLQAAHQSRVEALPAFETGSDDRIQVDERETGGQTRQFHYAVVGDARQIAAAHSGLDEIPAVDLIGKGDLDGGHVWIP